MKLEWSLQASVKKTSGYINDITTRYKVHAFFALVIASLVVGTA